MKIVQFLLDYIEYIIGITSDITLISIDKTKTPDRFLKPIRYNEFENKNHPLCGISLNG
jgi:hypothetical protein